MEFYPNTQILITVAKIYKGRKFHTRASENRIHLLCKRFISHTHTRREQMGEKGGKLREIKHILWQKKQTYNHAVNVAVFRQTEVSR